MNDKTKILGVVCFLLISLDQKGATAQQRNFEVVSEKVTCDQLPDTFDNMERVLELILNTKFRDERSFRINRKKGLKSGRFLSCDRQYGYLILQYDDRDVIYEKVAANDWVLLTKSNDPEGFILDNIGQKYRKL